MNDDLGRTGELAAAVADRTPVDWEAETRAARHPEEQALVQSLKLISSVAAAHHALHPVPRYSGVANPDPGSSSSEGRTTEPSGGRPDTIEPVPRRWGPLEILEIIGRGSYGDVFRARDETLDREVALKLLSPESSGHEKRAAAVVREGRLLARVRHPNVVTVHGAAEVEGRTGIWMELIRGRTLEAHLREHGRLGAREAALIGTDLCRALAAVHGAGLVHGDVKTLNVMREEGGRTVLMDFGTGLEVPLESSPSNRGLCGTPLYLAPEIHRGEEATPRSDLFSLGVLLFHLVTGGYPFVARTLSELTEAHRRGKWRHLRDARADLPDAFVQVVERALAPDPADRFGSAGEMELALSTALREVERRDVVPGPSPINPIPAPEPTRRTLTPTRVVVAAASLAAAAMALFLIPRWLDGRDEIPVDTGRPPVFKEQASPSGTDVSGPGTVTQPLQQPEPFGAPPSPANAVTGGVKEPELPVAIPLAIEATLFQRGEIADRPLSNGDKVRTDDQLYLEITTTEPAHLYVLEQDEEGRAYVLFPLPGGDLRNPISPGAKQRLPGKLEGAAVNWKVSSAGGREAFLVVASRRRLAELEDLLSGIEPASFGLPVDATSTMVAALRRGIGGLEKEPSPSQAGPPFGMLREALTRLAAGQRSTEQIWLREIILQNPGK